MTEEDTALVKRMTTQIEDWDEEEPREDWWAYQRHFAEARDRIESLSAEVERLRWVDAEWSALAIRDNKRIVTLEAEVERMRGALNNIRALSAKRQCEGGRNETLAHLEGFARAGLGTSHENR